jgi:dCTP deaminase
VGLLVDTALRTKILAGDLVLGISAADVNTYVHGCAVELHIGDVFIPGSKEGRLGSTTAPRRNLPHCLHEGETAVISTLETFKLDDMHTAVVFPVSSVSFKGLLMTNPGHVDPGFTGALHVTVINMGSKPYPLEPGGRFLRALIFGLDTKVSTSGGTAKTVSAELLDTLSPDFLSVRKRGVEAAKNEVAKSVRTNTIVTYLVAPALATVAAAIAAIVTSSLAERAYSGRLEKVQQELTDLKGAERLEKLEAEVPLETRLLEIERRIDDVKAQKPSK